MLLFSNWVVSDSIATPWTVAHQAPLSTGFPRQENWSRLPFPSPGDLPEPGIEPVSPAVAGRFFTPESPRLPFNYEPLHIEEGLSTWLTFHWCSLAPSLWTADQENLSTHRPRWEMVEGIPLFPCAPHPPKYWAGQKVHMGFRNILWKNLNELLGHLLANPIDGDCSCHPLHPLIKIQGSIILWKYASHCYVHMCALYQSDQKLLQLNYHLYVKCLFPFIHPVGQPSWLREFLLDPQPVLIWILILVWGQCSPCSCDSNGEHNWKM